MAVKNQGKRNRKAGHKLERDTAKLFRDLGFDKCKTSRQASRLLDDSKVDIAFIPYNVQCKNGYKKRYPKPDEIFLEMKDALKENFPEDDPIHSYPKMLFHRIDGYKPEHFVVSMIHKEFIQMLDRLNKLESFVKDIVQCGEGDSHDEKFIRKLKNKLDDARSIVESK